MLQINYQDNGAKIAQLSLKRSLWLARLKVVPSNVMITPNSPSSINPVAKYIEDIYQRYYGATISVHYPKLLSVSDETGRILAAVGIRVADTEPLFLEQYFDEPIERMICAPRNSIVEIGNLASNGGGASLYLFEALSAYMHHQAYTKAVVTCTGSLEARLKLMGLDPKRLAAAKPNLLLGEGENWGSYYQTDPHVLVGSIDKGYQRLQHVLNAEFIDLPSVVMMKEH